MYNDKKKEKSIMSYYAKIKYKCGHQYEEEFDVPYDKTEHEKYKETARGEYCFRCVNKYNYIKEQETKQKCLYYKCGCSTSLSFILNDGRTVEDVENNICKSCIDKKHNNNKNENPYVKSKGGRFKEQYYTYKCGCKTTIRLITNDDTRKKMVNNIKNNMCHGCIEREEENKRLPELFGSPKQIEWAEIIRRYTLEKIKEIYKANNDEETKNVIKDIARRYYNSVKSTFWINIRYGSRTWCGKDNAEMTNRFLKYSMNKGICEIDEIKECLLRNLK